MPYDEAERQSAMAPQSRKVLPLVRVFFLPTELSKGMLRGVKEGWLSPVEGTRLEIERAVKGTVGSNPTPSALCDFCKISLIISFFLLDAVTTGGRRSIL